MEEKLAAYRNRKRKEAMVESVKNSVKGVLTWGNAETPASPPPPPAYVELEPDSHPATRRSSFQRQYDHVTVVVAWNRAPCRSVKIRLKDVQAIQSQPKEKSKSTATLRIERFQDREDIESTQSDESLDLHVPVENPVVTQVTYLLYFLLWATLYMIAIQFEFGAVYFILSSLVLIWKNTRSGPKKKGEVSAYSVFNPNCEAIDGTLKAEQFEREIRYGAAAVH